MEDARKQLIEEEIDDFAAKAQDELENPMRDEGISAVKTAALKLAYTHKYYNRSTDEIQLLPTIASLLIGSELFEEAEKHYYEDGDDYPLKYIAAFKTTAYASGVQVPDEYEAKDIETMKEAVGADDAGLFTKALKSSHKEKRMSMNNPFSKDFDEILADVDKEHSENFVNREAVEALRLAAITVGEEYSSLILCLMDDKIYEEAKEFVDSDAFPSDVQDAFKAVAMAKLKG